MTVPRLLRAGGGFPGTMQHAALNNNLYSFGYVCKTAPIDVKNSEEGGLDPNVTISVMIIKRSLRLDGTNQLAPLSQKQNVNLQQVIIITNYLF